MYPALLQPIRPLRAQMKYADEEIERRLNEDYPGMAKEAKMRSDAAGVTDLLCVKSGGTSTLRPAVRLDRRQAGNTIIRTLLCRWGQ
ncbi:hypothetical protein WM23_22400 [Burkholderia ubonensis]|nr:hypothetical protein WM23_22400 [Burkholderia ubonensis]